MEIPNRRSFLSCKSLRRSSFQEFRRAGSREPLTTRKSAPRPGKPQSPLRTRAKPTLYAPPPRACPKRNAGKTLLSGNIFRGHYGGRIFASTARKSHHPTSAEKTERIAIYKCYNRSQHKQNCDGPFTYWAKKVDAVVDQLIRNIFSRAKTVDEREFIKKQVASTSAQYQRQLKKAKANHGKAVRELSKREDLMLDSIEGTCVFTPE